jgi:hypothetical protein
VSDSDFMVSQLPIIQLSEWQQSILNAAVHVDISLESEAGQILKLSDIAELSRLIASAWLSLEFSDYKQASSLHPHFHIRRRRDGSCWGFLPRCPYLGGQIAKMGFSSS